jgi:hypothetical protein
VLLLDLLDQILYFLQSLLQVVEAPALIRLLVLVEDLVEEEEFLEQIQHLVDLEIHPQHHHHKEVMVDLQQVTEVEEAEAALVLQDRQHHQLVAEMVVQEHPLLLQVLLHIMPVVEVVVEDLMVLLEQVV